MRCRSVVNVMQWEFPSGLGALFSRAQNAQLLEPPDISVAGGDWAVSRYETSTLPGCQDFVCVPPSSQMPPSSLDARDAVDGLLTMDTDLGIGL